MADELIEHSIRWLLTAASCLETPHLNSALTDINVAKEFVVRVGGDQAKITADRLDSVRIELEEAMVQLLEIGKDLTDRAHRLRSTGGGTA